MVGDDLERQRNRAQGTRAAANGRADFGVGRQAQGACDLRQLGGLDGVELMVATQHQRDQPPRFPALDDEGLEQLAGRPPEKCAHGVDAVLARGRDFGQRLGRRGALLRRRQGGCEFDVGRVVAGVGYRDGILAGIGQHMELMGVAAADAAGVGQYRAKLHAQAPEDVAVGGVHALIGCGEAGLVDVERIGVLHEEFARAHHAEAGSDFVAELGLDLVEVGGQIAVAANLVAHQVGNDFLVGRAEAERPLVPVLEAQQLRAVLFPASRFLPEVGRLDHGHQHLLGARRVHLLAHDGLHLAQHAQAQRQPTVKAGRELADHAGAQHQLMTDDFRFCRSFLERGHEQAAGAHRTHPYRVSRGAFILTACRKTAANPHASTSLRCSLRRLATCNAAVRDDCRECAGGSAGRGRKGAGGGLETAPADRGWIAQIGISRSCPSVP